MIAFNDYYRSKQVFVTGHTGFKGSWLTLWLERLGAKVSGYSNTASQTGFGGYGIVRDLRDYHWLLEAIETTNPELVFHLAAQALVSVGHTYPALTFDTNVQGTVNLLEALRNLEFKGRICVVTSDKVYDTSQTGPYDEQARLGGKDPYSASKAAAEMVCSAYRGFGLDIVTLRAGNVIGGGDWGANRVVPDCVRALREGKPVVLRAPESTRPFQYVLDCLAGYLLAGCVLKCPPALNFSPGESHTVQELVDEFLLHWGGGLWVRGQQWMAETAELSVNSGLAERELGWGPVMNFLQSVASTAGFYKAVTAGAQPRSEALAALENYERLAEGKAVWATDWLSDLTP